MLLYYIIFVDCYDVRRRRNDGTESSVGLIIINNNYKTNQDLD